MTTATSTFDLDRWDEEPYDEDDVARLSRARVTKTFRGDIEGASTAELLLAYAQDQPRAYVGFERVVASVHGQGGTIVIHHNAGSTGEVQEATWTIVPDSGTGELSGLRGEAAISVAPDGGHSMSLEYEVDRAQ